MKILTILMMAIALHVPATGNAETSDAGRTEAAVKPQLTDAMIDAGLGLAMFRGGTGWAINAGVLKEWNRESTLYYGADISLNLWNFSAAGNVVSSGATGVQLLPTVVYFFTLEGQRNLRPYLGASFGPHLYFSRTTTVGGAPTSDSRVLLELLFRPGVALNVGRNVALQIESKLGILDADFIFLPQVNAAIPL